jgi:hypothetical protein
MLAIVMAIEVSAITASATKLYATIEKIFDTRDSFKSRSMMPPEAHRDARDERKEPSHERSSDHATRRRRFEPEHVFAKQSALANMAALRRCDRTRFDRGVLWRR